MTVYGMWALFAVLAAAAVFQPWIGVVAYMGYVTLGPDSHYGFMLAPLLSTQRIIGAAVFVGLLFNSLPPFRLTPLGRWSVWSLTGFILVAFASVVDSLYPEKSWWFWDHLWKIWLIVLLAVRLLDSPRKITAAIWMIVLAQGFNAVLVNREYFGMGFSITREAGRHALDNNTYGLSTLPPMAFAAALCIYCKPIWQRLLAGGILALEVHQMLLLDSRGGMASMLVMFALGLLLMPKRIDTMGGAAIVLALGLSLAGPQVVKRFESIFAGEKKLDESAQSRFHLWNAGFRIMNEYPFLGAGLFAGEKLVPKFSPFKDEKEKALHNLALDIGSGTGYFGLAFFIAFFVFGWLCAMKLLFLAKTLPTWAGTAGLGASCGLPSYWFGSMFSSSALIEAPYLAVAIVVCAYSIARSQRPPPQTERSIDPPVLVVERPESLERRTS
jgi:hypothetical protein